MQNASEVKSVMDDQMVQAFPPEASDKSFAGSIWPRRENYDKAHGRRIVITNEGSIVSTAGIA